MEQGEAEVNWPIAKTHSLCRLMVMLVLRTVHELDFAQLLCFTSKAVTVSSSTNVVAGRVESR